MSERDFFGDEKRGVGFAGFQGEPESYFFHELMEAFFVALGVVAVVDDFFDRMVEGEGVGEFPDVLIEVEEKRFGIVL